MPLGWAAWFILRRRVVEPRAGYMAFSCRRRERSTREGLGTVAVGIGLLVLVVLLTLRVGGRLTAAPAGGGPGTGGHLVDAGPALLMALASIVAAGLTRSPRFAVYGVVLVGSGALAVLAGAGPAFRPRRRSCHRGDRVGSPDPVPSGEPTGEGRGQRMARPVVPELDGFLHEPARLRILVFLAMVEAADFMFLRPDGADLAAIPA